MSEELSKIYQLNKHENHHKLISLGQGDFGDDSPKVPASEIKVIDYEFSPFLKASMNKKMTN